MANNIIAILQSVQCPELDFSRSKNFLEDGFLDSFDVALVVAALDKTYSISIPGVEIVPENFLNLEAIESLVRRCGVQP